MESELKKVFKKAIYHPESRLSDGILSYVENQQKRINNINFYTHSFLGVFSLVVFIPTFVNLLERFSSSGFYNYFSLIFQRGGSLSYYWKELLLSIVNSLPILSLTFTVLLLFIMFVSLRRTIRQFVLVNRLSLI